ncbi:hypothetical protein BFP70_03365 [Thioclava sp. SK-1]|uniref:efflux RND transporter periplasmic adaptor subunit n=1 Tax=Thioclava sp. SK-1 TaxID=1889770 RepID=UPI0008263C71|nr:HlyD family efflux transporter periplasmic adaptor subunit [Thioclava sp. SK-1]OCX67204.1 hypothetical protein BFP70_03365 [Thioclava sp. SK-1]
MHRYFLRLGVVWAAMALQAASAETYTTAAIIRVEQQTELSAPLTAQIIDMPLRVGDRFAQGDLLLGFDCTRYLANLAEAEATANGARARHAINAKLDRYNAIGKGELQVSQADVDAATARADSMANVVKDCQIFAPYDGRVVATPTSLFATPETGAPLLQILQDKALVIDLIAPSIWLRWLKPGQSVQLSVRETGQVLPITIDRIGPAVDPVSQTIDVFAVFDAPPEQVLPGMSGTVAIEGPALND